MCKKHKAELEYLKIYGTQVERIEAEIILYTVEQK